MMTLDQLENSTNEEIKNAFGGLFDDMLDITNDEIVINGLSFAPSMVLKEMDPIAYEQDLYDYALELVENNK